MPEGWSKLPFLKSIHYISLYMFLGAPFFWHLLWRPALHKYLAPRTGASADPLRSGVYDNVRGGLLIGFSLFAVSGLVEAFVTGSFGTLVVAKIGFAAVAALCWHAAGERSSGGAASGVASGDGERGAAAGPAIAGGILFSGALLVVMGMLGRASGGPDVFSVVNHVIHLLASIVWAGGLLYGALLPWYSLRAGQAITSVVASVTERFSTFAFVAVALVAGSGAFNAYVRVPTTLALQQTTYGRTLALKIILFVALFLVAVVNFLVFAPGVRQVGRSGNDAFVQNRVGRLAAFVRIEAVFVLALLVASGMMTSLAPSDVAAELVHGVWELETDSHSLTVEMSAGDIPGQLQLDLHVTDSWGLPPREEVQFIVDMVMPAHDMGIQPLHAERVGPGLYEVRPLLSMDGKWETTVTVVLPDGERETASFEFEAYEGARSAGMTRRIDFRAVFFEFRAERAHRAAFDDYTFSLGEYVIDFVFSLDQRPLHFVSGLFWFLAALYVVVAALRGDFARWVAPLGMVALGVGAYFLFGSMLVDAYPTTYVNNPVPFTSASVETGHELYIAHCSVCHGLEGHGDGEMAPFLDPPPEDLRVRHIDAHPDGELFWWFTHGIPGSDMPSNEHTMTDEERWHVVNFVRSLHRGVP